MIEQTATRYAPIVVWGAHIDRLHASNGRIGQHRGRADRGGASDCAGSPQPRLFFGNPDVPEFADRWKAFAPRLTRPGWTNRCCCPHLTTEASRDAIEPSWPKKLVNGIAAASDVIAMSALQALSDVGPYVPADVAIIGYDDVMVASDHPPLTTIRQDVARGAAPDGRFVVRETGRSTGRFDRHAARTGLSRISVIDLTPG